MESLVARWRKTSVRLRSLQGAVVHAAGLTMSPATLLRGDVRFVSANPHRCPGKAVCIRAQIGTRLRGATQLRPRTRPASRCLDLVPVHTPPADHRTRGDRGRPGPIFHDQRREIRARGVLADLLERLAGNASRRLGWLSTGAGT